MKYAVRFALILVVVGLTFTGCKNLWPDTDLNPGFPAFYNYSQPDTFTIKYGSGQNLAGYAIVYMLDSTMVVKIELLDGWFIQATHVDIASHHNLIPQNASGRLLTGQFRYTTDPHNPWVNSFTYVCPEYRATANSFASFGNGWGAGDSWAIAIHVTCDNDTTKDPAEWESTWVPEFDSKGNAFYYGIRDVWKDVTLPEDNVRMRYIESPWNDSNAYFRVELADVPGDSGDYAVWNGDEWRGWCAEANVLIVADRWYDVRLWSSLNPQLPIRLQNDGWDNVNWLLNNKDVAAGWEHLQYVVWCLLDEFDPDSIPVTYLPLARDIYDEAVAEGDGYRPPSGGWIAAIAETPEQVQLVFIEVDP